MILRLPTAAAALRRGVSTTLSPPSLTPLFIRPFLHSATPSSLQAFHGWAKTLAISFTPLSPHDPSPSDLLLNLSWLLQDASSDPHLSFLHRPSPSPVPMRVGLDELYQIWRERVEERRPLQYIVGCEHWRDLVVVVREGVLIPRPETEVLVDLVGEVEDGKEGVWAELGTGSGAVAVGIGRVLGDGGRVVGTDLSPVAVEVARVNVQRYGLKDKVEIRQGSWFEPLEDVKGKLAGVVSNPPYIPSNDIPGLQAEVGRHEPSLALDGGEDGMKHLVHLCEGCCSALRHGGFFAFETNGDEHTKRIAELLDSKWRGYFRDVKIVADFAGINRFITGYRC